MYTLPPFMDKLLSKERKLMKWVGIFHVGVFWVVIVRGGENFPGESLMGENFLCGNFPWREFS